MRGLMSGDVSLGLAESVELRGFEPLTFCMPCINAA